MIAGPAGPGPSSSGQAGVGMVPSVQPLNPKVAALGGGHGLFAALSALRRVTRQLSAIVTVADDGGSSGRLRRQYGVLPPGDLRMALAALCGDDAWGTTWSRVVQHRFTGEEAELGGHAVGNVLIVALWELLGDTVQGLDWVGRLLGAYGRVLPMASVPLDLVAELKAWFEPLMGFGEQICVGIGAPVLLDLRGPKGLAVTPAGQPPGIILDFVDQLVRPWDGVELPRYVFRIDRPLVEILVREHEVDWVNSLFLSLRFRAARKGPYNEFVYTWFKCLDLDRLQYAEGFYAEKAKSEGSFVLDGWEIQRRCPHMKADLTRFATIEEGVLTCSLHGWQYELASGRCLTSEGHEITARLLSPEELVALEAAASGGATVAAAIPGD